MIGDKITINGQEWEEIDYDEFESINNFDDVDNSGMFMFGTNDEKLFYKKVIKEVFPKVFEGTNYAFRIEISGDFSISRYNGRSEHFTEEDIEALKQALAFRDKMLGEKQK